MARLSIPDQARTLTEPDEISRFLAPHGIWYERWELEGRVSADATDEQILSAYQPEIERLKAKGNYVTADVINVQPETPGLDQMLNKFNKEHTHREDEIRFTVKGRGVFHIHPTEGPVFAIEVEAGDLINVPAGTRHWFDLCADRTIRCIRLFEDASGWTPHYEDDGIHQRYQPVCWGPQHLPQMDDIKPLIKP